MRTGITLEEALALMEGLVRPLETEELAGEALLGRVLAEGVTAPMDQPPFDRSPLDGYALRAADTAGASQTCPARLEEAGTVYAGERYAGTVEPGQCVRIMTGAPIPAGADCVIRQEDTNRGRPQVEVYTPLRPYENYCFAGEDYKKGTSLLPAGTALDAAALGLLAGAGLWRERLRVFRRPSVLLAGTGDELAEPGAQLGPGQIYNSNVPQLAARCRELGLSAGTEQLSDDPRTVAEALLAGAERFDCIITTGGVSVGDKDIFHQALPLTGAEQIFWRVNMKPGTPLMFSLLRGKPVLSLSGNPFAAAATFELFARPMLAWLAGRKGWRPTELTAPLATPFGKGSGVRRFVRGVYAGGAVTLPEGHSSGQLRSAVGCNCLAELPAGSPPLAAGTAVRVILL